jgi:transposase
MRTKPAGGSWPSLASDQSRPPHSSRRSATEGPFHKGREFAAWMGVVPREHSTGGQQKLLGISKRGNSYLRRLFVQGARAVLQQRTKQSSGLSPWLAQLTSRTHRNVAAVALANKLARITWAVLAKNEQYRASVVADVTAA